MTDKVRLGLLSTGVPGLDVLLGGGLTEFSFTLIAGAPGSGKTTLAHQIMFALSSGQRRALFFTVLGEPPLKMLRYQQQFTFFDMTKVGPCIRYVNLADDLRAGHFNGVLERIMREVEDFQPGLVFVDSFRSVMQTARGGGQGLTDLQEFIQELGSRMATWQATTFLIGEYAHTDAEAHPIITVADGARRRPAGRARRCRAGPAHRRSGPPALPGPLPEPCGAAARRRPVVAGAGGAAAAGER